MSNTASTATKASTPPDKRAQHTPGPWGVYEEPAIDYRPCQIYGAGGESQVAWLAGGGRKRAIAKPEERANARLIAAAPELLEALRLSISCEFACTEREVCEIIEAAIAKAEGTSSIMSGKTFQQIAQEQLAKLRADFEQPRFGYPWTKCADCGRHECAGDCAYHRNVGPIEFVNLVLQYHPDELSDRKSESTIAQIEKHFGDRVHPTAFGGNPGGDTFRRPSVSEGNSIYDGPNMGEESELDSWADHPEPNEDEAPELLPAMPLQLTWPG